MRISELVTEPLTNSHASVAAMAAALSLTVGCGFVPPEGDFDDDDGPSATSDDPDPSAGTEGTPPPSTSGAEASGAEASTGIDPSATSTTEGSDDRGSDGGTTGDASTSDGAGEESSSTGAPADPCDEIDRACVTFAGGDLVVFQLVTGTIFDVIPVPLTTDDSHSITWLDNHVYACAGEPQTLVQIEVPTGAIVDSGLACTAVASVSGDLVVRRGSIEDFFSIDYAYYDDFAAVMAGAPSSVTDYDPDLHRITATDDTLVSSWHSSDHYSRHDLATTNPLGDVMFDGHDHWVMGMDVVEGHLLISTWFSEPMRHIAFDLATGARTCELPSAGGALDFGDGLACYRVTGEAPPPPPPPA